MTRTKIVFKIGCLNERRRIRTQAQGAKFVRVRRVHDAKGVNLITVAEFKRAS